jgi:tetratricopeptide (TPR) repeat protein
MAQDIHNPASNYGAQGNFYGAVNFYQNVAPRTVDPNALARAQALLAQMPVDASVPIPEPGQLAPISFLNQLTPNPLFTGREEELRQLARQFTSVGTAAITTGIGGIGKTQLAVEFAHRYGPYFAGGVFWISCENPDAVGTAVLACGARGLVDWRTDYAGLPADQQLPLTLSAWQSPLPRLLIFDNCEDERVLAAWQPPVGGCRVLVTSRRTQWSPTLRVATLPLDSLTEAQAIELLQRYRPDPDLLILRKIVNEVGCLPLALHLAGSYLRKYRSVKAQHYYDELVAMSLTHESLTGRGAAWSPTGHELDIARTIALSYDKLDPAFASDAAAQTILAAAAAMAPGEPIPPQALRTAFAPMGERAQMLLAEDGIARLAELGLLEHEEDDTVRIHRLIAAFVQRQGNAAEAVAGMRATVITAVEAAREDWNTYLEVMTPWQVHLLHLADQRGADPRQTARLNQLAGEYLARIYQHTKAEIYYQQALTLFRQVGDRLGEANVQKAIGDVQQFRDDRIAALASYEVALTLFRQVGDRLGEANVQKAIGDVQQFRDDRDAALASYEVALTLFRQVGDRLGEANVQKAIGDVQQFRDDRDAALASYQTALTLFRQVGDRVGEANTLAAQGKLALISDDQPQADQFLAQAITIYQHIGDRYSVPAQTGNYGWALRRIGQPERARPYLLQAAELFAAMGLDDYAEQHRRAAETPVETTEQQIARIIAETEAAVAQALADDDDVQRTTLAEQIEVRAQWAAEGEAEGSPYLALAASLRELRTQLDV